VLVSDRRRRVLDRVRRHGSAEVAQLARELDVSEWTVRRDLVELERQGLLRRTRGGAFVRSGPSGLAAEPATGDGAADAAKGRIGARAAQLLRDDSTIMVLAGSTTAALLPHLQHRRLTLVTNGLEIANGLKHAPDISLVMVGGYLHREQMTLLGPLTERAMADMHVDVIVAGAYGVHPETGITGAKIIQAGYHQSMLRHTDAVMVLADSSKLGRQGPTVLAPIEAVGTLVTDAGAPDGIVDLLRQRGPDVVIA
jgi:DeoR/GlpR family transcriptional regulator of sugar metabolism